MAAKEDAPRFSQWRRVTALAGVALGTCLLAPLAVSCDARSSLTGELCEPAQNSGNLRGRRLSAHHIVHHVYGAGQHVMQHAYGAGSSVAHHVYFAGSSMMNHVYGAGSHVVHHVYHSGSGPTYQTSQLQGHSLVQGAPAHIVSKVYGPEDSKEIHIVSRHHGYHIVGGGRINDFGSDPFGNRYNNRYTHTIVHHNYGGHPGETYYVHPGSHHFMDHFADGAHVDCTDTGNWYYEWDAHKKHLCCSAVHVGCPGTWRGPEDHWMDSDTVDGGFLNGKRPADVDSGIVDDGFVNGKRPADVDHWMDSDTVDGGFLNGKRPADVDHWMDSDTVDGGFLNGKRPADVDSGMVDDGFVNGKRPADVDHWMDSDTVDGGFLNGKRPADVDHWMDSDTVDGGFLNGKRPADVDSGMVDDGFVNGKGPADVSDFADDGMVDSGTVEGGVVDDGTVESGSMDAVEGEVAEPEHTFLAEPIEKKKK